MRVRVLQILAGQECAGLFEHGHDDGIGGPHFHAFESWRGTAIPGARVHVDATGGVHAAGGVNVVADASIEIVRAMCWRRVHRAGASIRCNVSGQHTQNAALQKRVLEGGALKDAALEPRQFGSFTQLAGGGNRRGQFCRDDVDWRVRYILIGCRGGQRHVLKVGMEGHGH